MKVIWFQGNFGNQIFYCAYKDYLTQRYPNENVYAYVDKNCPPLTIEERTNLTIPRKSVWVDIISLFVFKILGVLFRRMPQNLVPKWYCGNGVLNDKATFFAHSTQAKFFYEGRRSDWLVIKEPEMSTCDYLKWKHRIVNGKSVCVHLRRGDYIKTGSAYVDLSSISYYQKAMDYAKGKLPDAEFYFFSDDMDYVKTVFKGENIYYVDCNQGCYGYLDILLMSLAKINIIANSTFSYWAAYINNEQKTVIYPKEWFSGWTGRKAPDIMLDDWIAI